MTFRTARLSLLVAGALVAAMATPGLATMYTTAGGAIPDNQPGNALLLNFAVTDVGAITSVDLTLTGLTHTWIGDIVATLTGPSGSMNILNRTTNNTTQCASTVGNSANTAGNYLFQDGGANIAAALASSPVTLAAGTYTASDRVVASTCTAPISFAAVFNGGNAVGNWTLSVSDNAAADVGTLTSATLNVVTVPEPATFGVLLLGLGILGLRRR